MIRFPALALLLAVVILLQERAPRRTEIESATFKFNEMAPTLPADALRLLSFGYSRVFSGLLWLRFLQYTPTEKVPPGELSWIYLDLDSITTLDPEFLPAFEEAGIFLSVVTDDHLGAKLLLEKGVRLHPDRWQLRANLAYHYRFEVKDEAKAQEQYLAASRLPGAPVLFALIASRGLGPEAGIAFLEGMKAEAKDENVRKRLQERIDQMRSDAKKGRGSGDRD